MSSLASPGAYRQSAVLTASREVLVVMLYDGARRFLHQAAAAMADNKIPVAHVKLRRAEDIILYLRNTLDMEQGEIATSLERIYVFFGQHLRQARLDRDPAKIEQVSNLLGDLRGAWAAISQQ
jgi:flagellar secretion chaperone FliS